MTSNLKEIAGMAILWAIDLNGKTVYKEMISIHDYYDGDHPWDKVEWIKKKSIVLRGGLLIDGRGNFMQNWLISVNPKTGYDTNTVMVHDDGKINISKTKK